MKLLPKRLLQCAAIICLGLAGSPFAAFAQAPAPGGPAATNAPKPPKYDLVASKKREGSAFILTVHNAGQQIMPTGKVDVVEVVPAGLTITSFPSGPWTCTGVLPVVGPDSFTCSYQIPSGGIPANSNLPQIALKSEGKSECPNCMRVKLYLKEVSDGVKPVDESDIKNNASCIK
jgi:hypothetical protein